MFEDGSSERSRLIGAVDEANARVGHEQRELLRLILEVDTVEA